MFRKIVLLILLVQVQLVFSQETYKDLLTGKRSFAVGLNDALVHNFNFTYTKYTPKQYAYEFLIGYRFNDVLGSLFTSLVVKDQPWLYNQYTLRFGIKFYTHERL